MKNFLKKAWITTNVATMSLVGGKALGQKQAAPAQSDDLIALNEPKAASPTSLPAKTASFNENAKAATESSDNENRLATIEQGSGYQAATHSGQHRMLVLHVSGGANEKYTAQQYAVMLQDMFADTAYTNNPINVAVKYEESGEDRPTGVIVFFNGGRYDKNGGKYEAGDGAYHPYALVGNIEKITSEYAQKYGSFAAVSRPSGSPSLNNE